jgi:hypothetical protein
MSAKVMDDGFALADRLIGHDSVKRRHSHGQVDRILVDAQGGYLHLQVAAQGVGVGLGLIDLGHGLGNRSDVGVVSRLLGVVILLGQNSGRIKGLGAIPIQLLLFQIGLGVFDIGLGGFLRGDIGEDVGSGRGDSRLLAGKRGLLLDIFNGGNGLALLDQVAFLYIEMGNASHGGSA